MRMIKIALSVQRWIAISNLSFFRRLFKKYQIEMVLHFQSGIGYQISQ